MLGIEHSDELDGPRGVRDVEYFDETSTTVAADFFCKRLELGFTAGARNHDAPAPRERKRQASPDARGGTRYQCATISTLHPVPRCREVRDLTSLFHGWKAVSTGS
jgi:hypothetical protein